MLPKNGGTKSPNFTKEFKIIAYMYRKLVGTIFKLCFSHYLPKALLDRYTDNSGLEFKLSEQQMADVNPLVDIRLVRRHAHTSP